jgi:tRNA threonylcarbamoyladenosine biosynthesis protein TsaE
MSTGSAWTLEFRPATAGETQALAASLARVLRSGDLLVLSGELGAGKTTFTQGLGAGLGVRSGIISPTFVLVRTHPSLGEGPDLVHVDAYRLGSAAEIDDLDLESTMDTAVTVIEWGAGRVEHLSESRLEVALVRRTGSTVADGPADDDEPRLMRITAFGPRWEGLSPELSGGGCPAGLA